MWGVWNKTFHTYLDMNLHLKTNYGKVRRFWVHTLLQSRAGSGCFLGCQWNGLRLLSPHPRRQSSSYLANPTDRRYVVFNIVVLFGKRRLLLRDWNSVCQPLVVAVLGTAVMPVPQNALVPDAKVWNKSVIVGFFVCCVIFTYSVKIQYFNANFWQSKINASSA